MLHQRIRLLRQARNMSQVELAAIFSVSTDYMLGLESGEYLDVSGLPREVIAHIRQLVDDLRAK
nr:helix-turn-helix transcriptional regulator [uncultured Oscillibacter sp.]